METRVDRADLSIMKSGVSREKLEPEFFGELLYARLRAPPLTFAPTWTEITGAENKFTPVVIPADRNNVRRHCERVAPAKRRDYVYGLHKGRHFA